MGEWDWQALQLEWDTSQLDDWDIDPPDFTDEQEEGPVALISLYIRVPKVIPLLELFSSNGGTFQFQRRNFRVPTEELFDSYGGNHKSLRGRRNKTSKESSDTSEESDDTSEEMIDAHVENRK